MFIAITIVKTTNVYQFRLDLTFLFEKERVTCFDKGSEILNQKKGNSHGPYYQAYHQTQR